MTVGAVAGHLFLVVRRVDQHLDEPEPADGPTLSPRTFAWPRVDRSDDLDREQHRTVRGDGEHVARWGWSDVASAYAERVEKLTGRLEDAPRHAVALGDGVMDLDTYLATRIVELLVHADDLAVSVGLEPAEPPRDAATIALGVLVEAGRTLHGDLALRARLHPTRASATVAADGVLKNRRRSRPTGRAPASPLPSGRR